MAPESSIAHDLVRREAETLGAVSRVDAAGNLYLTRRAATRNCRRSFIGSHLDSVAHGGNFDGAAGVVAGLAVMADLVAQGIETERDLTVLVTRAEEAVWFPLSYPGNQAALGLLELRPIWRCAASIRGGRLPTTCGRRSRPRGGSARGRPRSMPDRIAASSKSTSNRDLASSPRPADRHRHRNLEGSGMSMRAASALYAHSGAEPRFARRDACSGLCRSGRRAWKPYGTRLEARAIRRPSPLAAWNPIRRSMAAAACLANLASPSTCAAQRPRILDSIDAATHRALRGDRSRRGVRFDLGPTLHLGARDHVAGD